MAGRPAGREDSRLLINKNRFFVKASVIAWGSKFHQNRSPGGREDSRVRGASSVLVPLLAAAMAGGIGGGGASGGASVGAGGAGTGLRSEERASVPDRTARFGL